MKILVVLLVLAVDVGSSKQIHIGYACDKLALDVVAVIDGSDSIHENEFKHLRDGMVRFVTDYGVQQNMNHFGSIVYSSGIAQVINLSGNKANILARLSNMPHPKEGTRTELGIEQMINMFTSYGRVDAPHVGIIISDGNSQYRSLTLDQAQKAKDKGVVLLAVGIGSTLDKSELEAIVSSGHTPQFINNFNGLAQVIMDLICPSKYYSEIL